MRAQMGGLSSSRHSEVESVEQGYITPLWILCFIAGSSWNTKLIYYKKNLLQRKREKKKLIYNIESFLQFPPHGGAEYFPFARFGTRYRLSAPALGTNSAPVIGTGTRHRHRHSASVLALGTATSTRYQHQY